MEDEFRRRDAAAPGASGSRGLISVRVSLNTPLMLSMAVHDCAQPAPLKPKVSTLAGVQLISVNIYIPDRQLEQLMSRMNKPLRRFSVTGSSGRNVWISKVRSAKMWRFKTKLIQSNLLELWCKFLELWEPFSCLSERDIRSFIMDVNA